MESSWIFFNIDEVLYRGWLLGSWLWEWLIYIVTFKWLWGRGDASSEDVLARLSDLGLDGSEITQALNSMKEMGLSNSDMLAVLADVSGEGLLGIAALRAIEGINPLNYLGDASTHGDGWFRLFGSRPSNETDSIQSYLNPVGDQNIFETMWGVLFGTGDKESIFTILFFTPFGWILIGIVCAWFVLKFLKNKVHFLEHKHKLLYDMAHTGHIERQANDKSARWQRITELVTTDEQNDWKIAIMDADILLDEVLAENGFAGSTVGERLQDARRGKMTTVEYAGEAHGIRNKLAHTGGYDLSQREAKTAISMYEQFFNELYHL